MEIIFYGLLGLIIGSFLNVLILREGKRDLWGRSACMHCNKELAWFDLVPVFSWLLLRGKCRYCGHAISYQYVLVEVLSALLFAFVGGAPIPGIEKAVILVFISLSVAIAVYDLYYTLIPDLWNYFLGASALVYALLTLDQVNLIPGLVAGPLSAFPLFALWFVSRGAWMGFGDVKLAFAMGWLLGPVMGPVSILFAFVLGAAVSVSILLPLPYYAHMRDKIRVSLKSYVPSWGQVSAKSGEGFTMKSEVPFGPFLIASCLSVWFLSAYGFEMLFFL